MIHLLQCDQQNSHTLSNLQYILIRHLLHGLKHIVVLTKCVLF
jgi:hypothetical protein